MFLKSKQSILCQILCVILILNFTLGVNKAESTTDDQPIVLFDDSHGQFFNHTLYSKALSDLEENGMKVIVNQNEINETTLGGVDILIITNPSKSFTFKERRYIDNYITKGTSMLILANPLNEENDSINGACGILNDLVNELQPSIGSLSEFWTNSEYEGSYPPTDVICNDFSNAGKSNYLTINVNTSSHEIFYFNQNVTSLVTYSCSIESPTESVVMGSPEAYAKTTYDNIHPPYSTKLSLIATATPAESDIRVLLGGSSIMFSDLNDTYLDSSWYDSKNNSILWKNMIDWLARTSVTEDTLSILTEEVLLFMTFTILIAGFFLIIGLILFAIGSGQKKGIIKSVEFIEPESKIEVVISSESKDTDLIQEEKISKVTKRDRRLQQIKKHTRKKRKK